MAAEEKKNKKPNADPTPEPNPATSLEERMKAERALFKKYAATTDPGEKKALRDDIFNRYAGLIGLCCKRYASFAGLPISDINSAAAMALLKAIDHFDPDYGNGFPAYAMATIKGDVKNFCRNNGSSLRPPRDVSSTARRVRDATDKYYLEHGEYPTVQQLSAILDVPEERIQEAMEYHSPASLDSYRKEGDEDGDGDGKTLEDVLVGDDRYDSIDTKIALGDEIEKLSELDKKIIRGIYYDNKTQTQLAKELGISQMFVSREARKAVDSLRKGLNGG